MAVTGGVLGHRVAALYADIGARTTGLSRATGDVNRYAGKMERSLGRTTRAASRMSAALKVAGAGVAGYFGTQGLIGITRYVDRYQQLQNQIRAATKFTRDYTNVSKELERISVRVGSSLEANVKIFQFTSQVRKDLGATNEEMLGMIETLGQLGIISGASYLEMKFGLRQMAQGLAAGNLRAEELNSLLENIPEVAKRIAQEMGYTAGAFRQLVLAGEVTSKSVYQALVKMAADVDREFKRMPLTISRAWGALNVSVQAYIGNVDTAIGFTNTLAHSMQGTAEFFESITSRQSESEQYMAGITKQAERHLDIIGEIVVAEYKRESVYKNRMGFFEFIGSHLKQELSMYIEILGVLNDWGFAVRDFQKIMRMNVDLLFREIETLASVWVSSLQIGVSTFARNSISAFSQITDVMRTMINLIPGVSLDDSESSLKGLIGVFDEKILKELESIKNAREQQGITRKLIGQEKELYRETVNRLKAAEAGHANYLKNMRENEDIVKRHLLFRAIMEDPSHALTTAEEVNLKDSKTKKGPKPPTVPKSARDMLDTLREHEFPIEKAYESVSELIRLSAEQTSLERLKAIIPRVEALASAMESAKELARIVEEQVSIEKLKAIVPRVEALAIAMESAKELTRIAEEQASLEKLKAIVPRVEALAAAMESAEQLTRIAEEQVSIAKLKAIVPRVEALATAMESAKELTRIAEEQASLEKLKAIVPRVEALAVAMESAEQLTRIAEEQVSIAKLKAIVPRVEALAIAMESAKELTRIAEEQASLEKLKAIVPRVEALAVAMESAEQLTRIAEEQVSIAKLKAIVPRVEALAIAMESAKELTRIAEEQASLEKLKAIVPRVEALAAAMESAEQLTRIAEEQVSIAKLKAIVPRVEALSIAMESAKELTRIAEEQASLEKLKAIVPRVEALAAALESAEQLTRIAEEQVSIAKLKAIVPRVEALSIAMESAKELDPVLLKNKHHSKN